jgi:hypothetical protein
MKTERWVRTGVFTVCVASLAMNTLLKDLHETCVYQSLLSKLIEEDEGLHSNLISKLPFPF